MKALALGVVALVCTALLPGQIASKVRVASEGGPVYATIGGTETRIAPAGFKAWLVDGGRSIAYSAAGGAGGFEGEGQALYLYDVAAKRRTKALSEFYEITDVQSVASTSGKPALLVRMEDSGLGASHIAVVDPKRGEVFRQDGARFIGISSGAVTVGSYKDDDWEKLANGEKVKPQNTQQFNLDELLRRPVITNKAPARG